MGRRRRSARVLSVAQRTRSGRRGRSAWSGDRTQTTLWQIASRDQDAATAHGTQKPVECMRRPMLNNAAPGQPVYDPFLGSGTSVIAAETTGRICLGLELDPAYVDVIVRAGRASPAGAARLDGEGLTLAEARVHGAPSGPGSEPMRGRKPTPTSLKIIEGNPGRATAARA